MYKKYNTNIENYHYVAGQERTISCEMRLYKKLGCKWTTLRSYLATS